MLIAEGACGVVATYAVLLTTNKVIVLLHKSFWVYVQRHCLVRNQSFGTICVSHRQVLQGKPGDEVHTHTCIEPLKGNFLKI
jgi:hypothetical protein